MLKRILFWCSFVFCSPLLASQESSNPSSDAQSFVSSESDLDSCEEDEEKAPSLTVEEEISFLEKFIPDKALDFKKKAEIFRNSEYQASWASREVRGADAHFLKELLFSGVKELATRDSETWRDLSGCDSEERLSSFLEKKADKILKKIHSQNTPTSLEEIASFQGFGASCAPAGFLPSENFESHVNSLEESLQTFIERGLESSSGHVVVSAESLSEKSYPSSRGAWDTQLVKNKERKFFAITGDSSSERFVRDEEIRGKSFIMSLGEKLVFSAKFPQLDGPHKEREADHFCAEELFQIFEEFNFSAMGKKFSFSGDFGFPFVKDEGGKRTLRKGLAETLKSFSLVMIVSSGRFNPNIYSKLNDSWHKIKAETKAREPEISSLVVFEPYDPSYDYHSLSDNGLGGKQDVFLPNGESFVHKVEEPREVFSESSLMAHFPIRGQHVSIVNLSDAEGLSDSSKGFLFKKEFHAPKRESYLRHLRLLSSNLDGVCFFIEELIKEKAGESLPADGDVFEVD